MWIKPHSFDEVAGIGKYFRDVVRFPVSEIARHVFLRIRMEQWRIGRDRAGHFNDRRQCFIIHADSLDSVFRQMTRLRDDDRDRLADIAHDVERQRATSRRHHRASVEISRDEVECQYSDGIALKVLAGQHGDDTGNIHRRGDVYPLHPRKGVRRANKGCVQRTGRHNVGSVAAPPGDEAEVFLPENGLTYAFVLRAFG